MTTVFDAAGEGSAKACWVLMRRAKRTSLSPQALPRNLRGCSRLPVTAPKNRTGIGPHLGRRKVSLFSPKIGYVRRSELSLAGRRNQKFPAEIAHRIRRASFGVGHGFDLAGGRSAIHLCD